MKEIESFKKLISDENLTHFQRFIISTLMDIDNTLSNIELQLVRVNQNQVENNQVENNQVGKYLTVKEVCTILKISENTFYSRVGLSSPFGPNSSSVYILRSEVEKLIADRTINFGH